MAKKNPSPSKPPKRFKKKNKTNSKKSFIVKFLGIFKGWKLFESSEKTKIEMFPCECKNCINFKYCAVRVDKTTAIDVFSKYSGYKKANTQ